MEVLKECDRRAIKALIKNLSKEQGIRNYVTTNVSTNPKGEGFLSQFFNVTIQDSTSDKQLHLAIKTAFVDDNTKKISPIRKSFENEIYFYTKVYPLFKKFEKERGVLQTINLAPKCLKACLEEDSEMLALENLRVLGFEVFDKKRFLDDEHISLIFKNYAYFHAYSFALRDQRPEEYKNLAKGCYNIYEEFLKNEHRSIKLFLEEHCKSAEEYLVPGEDDEVINRFRKYGAKGLVEIFETIVIKNINHSAILHGDCWSNNMMFKYEKTNNSKRPVDMRLIDWQVVKVGSPVCDLSYCLYSGTTISVFDSLDKYLQIYYNSFSSFLRQLGSDPEKLFPLATLKEHWKNYSKFGLLMSFPILKMKMTKGSDDSTLATSDFDQEGYKGIIRNLLWHMTKVDAL